ncbi:unnamed protein product [Auanema sp. JU1783]|nr:unnamed protein product [Auanema sp. JU1783]
MDREEPLNVTTNSTFADYSDEYIEDSSETTDSNQLNLTMTEVSCFIKNPHENVDDHLKKRMDHCNFEGMECLPNLQETESQSSTQTHFDYYCSRKLTTKNSLTHYSCRFSYYYKLRKCENINECYTVHFKCLEYQVENHVSYFILLTFALIILSLIALKLICTQYFNHNRSGSYQLNSNSFKNIFKCF